MHQLSKISALAVAAFLPSACSRQSAAAPDHDHVSKRDHISLTHSEPRVAEQAFPGKFMGSAKVTSFLNPTDRFWTPPGVKHWHGGTETSAMAHVALQGFVDGKNVVWTEPVTDEQYAK